MRLDGNEVAEAQDGGSPSSSAYISRKDVKIVGIAVAVLAVMMYPIFKVLQRKSESSKCILNLKEINSSINQYATLNEDKFPPLYATGGADEPMLQSSGAPYTWASELFEYMNPRASFACPTATPQENSWSQNPRSDSKKFPVSYGMFAPLGAFNRSLVEDPNEAILIGETSNLGSSNTYDPIPFVDRSGAKLPYDGMVIGWDNDNFDGDLKSQFATRLAFPNSAGGKFGKEGESRHDDGCHFLTVSGQLIVAKPDVAFVEHRNKVIYGRWPMPLTARRHE
ncbi:MAG: hypothetical protein P4L46_21325 [Fimbriimonas sp.]|nr:hypothetical protein [Fimbriimonas sp.]